MISPFSVAAGAVGGLLISGPIKAFAQPWIRILDAAGNENDPNALFGMEALLNANNNHWLSDVSFRMLSRYHGYEFDPFARGQLGYINDKVKESLRTPLPFELAYILDNNDAWGEQSWSWNCRRHGIPWPAAHKALLDLQYLPDLTDILDNWRLGNLADDEARELLKKRGLIDTRRIDLLGKFSELPSIDLVKSLFSTNRIDEQTARKLLGAIGQRYQPVVDLVIGQLADQTPSLNAILSAYAGLVFDPAYVNRWGLYAGLSGYEKSWIEKAGAGKLTISLPGINGLGRETVSWGEVAWATSRPKFSRSEAVQLYQRLRAGRLERYQQVTPVAEFSRDDLVMSIRAEGYTPEQAPYVAALGYKVMGLREIRSGVTTGAMTDADALEHLLDIGYLPADAAVKLKIFHAVADQKRNAFIERELDRLGERTYKAIIKGYVQGIITRGQAVDQLVALGFKRPDAEKLMSIEDAELAHANVDVALKEVHNAFMNGAMGADNVLVALSQIGVQSPRREQLLSTWLILRNTPHRAETAQKIVRWYGLGLIPKADAQARLAELGHNLPESLLLLEEAQQKLDDIAARQLKAYQSTQARQAKQLEKVQQLHAREAYRLQQEVRRLTPPARLRLWLKKGIINESEFIDRYRALGIPDDITLRDIEDALSKGRTQNASASQRAQTGATTPGTSPGVG